MRKLFLAGFVLLLGAGLVFTAGACGSSSGGGAAAIDAFLGCYFYQLWAGNIAGPTNQTHWGLANADGLGMQTGGTFTSNTGGTLAGPMAFAPFPYVIAPDGQITWNGVPQYVGGISPDGSLMALGSTSVGSLPAVAILGLKGGGYSLASLSGAYHLAALFWNSSSEVAWWGTVTFDGAGSSTIDQGTNVNGTISVPNGPVAAGAYTVAGDGTTTWTVFGVGLQGGIMAGGELAVLSGHTAGGDIEFLLLLIKKGAGLGLGTFNGNYHYVSLVADNSGSPRYTSLTGKSTSVGAGTWSPGAWTSNVDGTIMSGPNMAAVPYAVAADGAFDLNTGAFLGGLSASGAVCMFVSVSNTSDPTLTFLMRY